MPKQGEFRDLPSFTTTYRLMGKTHATPFLRRSVSNTAATHIEFIDKKLPPVKEDAHGYWPVEKLVDKRVTSDGATQYLVRWRGTWPKHEKQSWQPVADCLAADVGEYHLDQLIAKTNRLDAVHGIPTHDEVINARGPRAHRTKRDKISLEPQSAYALARQQRYRNRVSRKVQAEPTSEAQSEAESKGADSQNTGNDEASDSEEDAEFEVISAEEQAFYASQSVFGM